MAIEFVFDTNKCTGCHACAVACIIENQVAIENSWRFIYTYNEEHHPNSPTYHLSLACNHCTHAPCNEYCPALAYYQDAESGRVVLDESKCMGCKYCTWVCPYDAPKFDRDKGIITKCTFCAHRLEKSLDPACVALCPTGALEINERSTNNRGNQVIGFSDYGISPGINLKPLNPEHTRPSMTTDTEIPAEVVDQIKNHKTDHSSKLQLKNEWTLLVLSLVIPFVIAWYASAIIQQTIQQILPVAVVATVSAMFLSISHLANKRRSFRAVFNWRKSWLSREIIFLSAFIILLFLSFPGFVDHQVINILTIICGILLLISMDAVYQVIPKIRPGNVHSAQVTLTASFWFAVFTHDIYIMAFIGALRIYLYLSRQEWHSSQIYFRLILGFFVPLLFVIEQNDITFMTAVLAVFCAELIDRLDYYNSFIIMTPQYQIELEENFRWQKLR